MKNCPHCGFTKGHYSVVEYKAIDTHPPKTIIESYWFCHSCAKLVYETDKDFVAEEK